MEKATFPGRYDSLERICDFVGRAAEKAGFDKQSIYAVKLAVDEACCNIIEHAYGGEGIGDLDCSVEIEEGALTITLHDHGRPFNPENVPSPRLGLPLSRLRPRGVGLYLIRKMMDAVHYETTPEAGNTLTMIKRLKTGP